MSKYVIADLESYAQVMHEKGLVMQSARLGMSVGLSKAAASLFLAFAASLGQQTQTAVRPGSGAIHTRDRGYRHKPRELEPLARAKHAAKMRRRYERWARGECFNPCVSVERYRRLKGVSE